MTTTIIIMILCVHCRHVSLFRDANQLDVELAQRATTVREFDEAITAPSFGHRNADAYYRTAGSAQRIDKVKIPTLCIQASDDPISLYEAIPFEAIENSQNLALIVTQGGGHLGWMCGSSGGILGMEATFIDDTVIDFWNNMWNL